jgi:hypothetical protein
MGFAVLHLQKGAGNDAPISSHIERTVNPANADQNRTHLNRELISFPDDVTNRTEAIQRRIENAGITRKISHHQVRAIRFIMSGTSEDMKRIDEAGKLDDWCNDSLNWLRNEVGNDNVVSAVLHLDEKTPHIHATVVPVVSGERRKAKTEKPTEGKKRYKKKNPNAARLCADDVMARDKLTAYQTSYAEAMKGYGLMRGREGSEARHISTQQYYRDLLDKNEHLKEDNEILQEEKAEVVEKVRDMYERKDEAQNKFLKMDEHFRQKEQELAIIDSKLQKAKQDYEPHKAQEELNLIHDLFPMMKEQLRIVELCRKIAFSIEHICRLLKGNTLSINSGKLFSPEHNQKFEVINAKMKIENEPGNPNKLRFNLDGMDILEWFKQKHKEFLQWKCYEITRLLFG